ncbi:MAG: hypothetical protein U9O65_09425 [Thermotogota bacterium]|nr:hypothetical protein [Thermotogota bacterium]
MKLFYILIFFLVCVSTFFSYGLLKFPNADVYYETGYKAIAEKAGTIFEEIRPLAIDLVGNDPGKINIVIKDIGTVTNGYAVPQYHKTIAIYTWPPDSYIAIRLNSVSWFRQVIMHEFTHIVHLSYISGVNRFLTNFFTGSELLSPQFFTPFGESVTLLAESSIHFAEGRLNNPVWSRGMYLSSIEGNYFPDLAYALAINDEDYRGGFLYYNYPAGFYEYLINMYGLSKAKKFHSIVAKMPPILGVIIASNKAFGKDINILYNEWKETLSNKSPIKQSKFKEIYTVKNGNITDIWSDDKLYLSYAIMGNASSWDNKHRISIASLNEKGKTSIEINGALPLRAKSDNGVLLTMQNNIEGSEYTRTLWKKDANGWEELFKGNITAFEINNKDIYIAYYDQKNESSTLLKNNSVFLETEFHIKDIEISDDGEIALLVDNEQRQGSIALIKLGGLELVLDDPVFKSSSIEWFNGKLIFPAAYNEKYMDAYAFDPYTKRLFQLSEGLFLEKIVYFKNKIYAIGNSLKSKGMAVFELEPLEKDIAIPELKNADQTITVDYEEGNFGLNTARYFINPVIHFPLVSFGSDGCKLGVGTIHTDPYEKHRLILSGEYDSNSKNFIFNADYNYKMTKRLSTQLNVELTLPSSTTGTVSLEYLGLDKILRPGITLNGALSLRYNIGSNFEIALKSVLAGDQWNVNINPYVHLTEDSVIPELSCSISMAPTLNTLIKGSFSTDEKRWTISLLQNILDIHSGKVPWLFVSEIALGTRINGVSSNFDNGVLYVTTGINDTWGFGIRLYPKVGISIDDVLTTSLFLELNMQP